MSLMSFQPGTLSLTRFCFFFFYIFGLLFYFLFIHTLYMLFYTKGFLLFLFFLVVMSSERKNKPCYTPPAS